MFRVLAAILAVQCTFILIMHCSATEEPLVSRVCLAQWALIGHYRNPRAHPVQQSFYYHVGIHQLQTSRQDFKYKKLKHVLVISNSGISHQATEFKTSDRDLRTYQLTQGITTVPAGSIVSVWQIAVRTDSETVNFFRSVTLLETESPPPITNCHVYYQERRRITEDTWVRLRHVGTRNYLALTTRKGWDAGTLSSSDHYWFRFEIVWPGTYRIISKSHNYNGYKYVYSSMGGGIYLDQSDTTNGKQLWTLSSNDLRDGDSITIQNVYYLGGYMTKYEGWTTDVYCLYISDPDHWIVEFAGR